MVIDIKTKFPVEFGKPVYGAIKERETRSVCCPACNGSGYVNLNGKFYACPACDTDGVIKKSEYTHYRVTELFLSKVTKRYDDLLDTYPVSLEFREKYLSGGSVMLVNPVVVSPKDMVTGCADIFETKEEAEQYVKQMEGEKDG